MHAAFRWSRYIPGQWMMLAGYMLHDLMWDFFPLGNLNMLFSGIVYIKTDSGTPHLTNLIDGHSPNGSSGGRF